MATPPQQRFGVIAQMLVIIAASIAGALAMRALDPHPLKWNYAWGEHVERAAQEKGMRTVTREEAREIATTFSHILLDARKTADFATGHLPGAMSLPLLEFNEKFSEISMLLTPEQPIVVYCSGHECDESLKLGEILINAGYTNIALFAGGMTAWIEAGYEVER
jgi:rhodanese-related sulfurtransferase